jgi:hypothetical protein
MAGHFQAEAMRLCRDRRHPIGIHRIVDLDFGIAARCVPAHVLERFVHAGGNEAEARRIGAAPFDEAIGHDARPGHLPGIDAGDQVLQERVVVAHVARGGDPGGQIEQARRQRGMRMHVVQPRIDRAALAIDHRLLGRIGRGGVFGQDLGDRVAHHHHGRQGGAGAADRIEHVDIADAQRRGKAVRQLLLQRQRAGRFQLGRQLAQKGHVRLVSGAHGGALGAGAEHARQPTRMVEQDIAGVELHPDDAPGGDRQGRLAAAQRELAHRLRADPARRQHGQAMVRPCHRRAGIERQGIGAVIVGDIERRAGRGLAAGVRLAFPTRHLPA